MEQRYPPAEIAVKKPEVVCAAPCRNAARNPRRASVNSSVKRAEVDRSPELIERINLFMLQRIYPDILSAMLRDCRHNYILQSRNAARPTDP